MAPNVKFADRNKVLPNAFIYELNCLQTKAFVNQDITVHTCVHTHIHTEICTTYIKCFSHEHWMIQANFIKISKTDNNSCNPYLQYTFLKLELCFPNIKSTMETCLIFSNIDGFSVCRFYKWKWLPIILETNVWPIWDLKSMIFVTKTITVKGNPLWISTKISKIQNYNTVRL